MKNKDPLGFDAGLARLARYVPEAQAGEEDDAQARTENKDPGNGGSPQARFLPSPREPMAVARRFLAEAATDAGTGELKLRHWRGGWWSWRTTHWREAEARHVRGLLYHFTEHALYGSPDGLELKPWSPNRHKIDDVLDALSSLCFLPNYYDQPTWLDDRESGTIVACKNGLLDVERRELMPHSPSFFNQTSVPFDYEPRARVPRALALVPEGAVAQGFGLAQDPCRLVRLRRQRPPRHAEDPAADRADPRRQGRDRPHPRRSRRPEERGRARRWRAWPAISGSHR